MVIYSLIFCFSVRKKKIRSIEILNQECFLNKIENKINIYIFIFFFDTCHIPEILCLKRMRGNTKILKLEKNKLKIKARKRKYPYIFSRSSN